MKKLCLFVMMLLMLLACSKEPDYLSVETVRNAKSPVMMNGDSGKGNNAGLAGAGVDAAANAGSTQFLGTWKITHIKDTKEAWNEAELGEAPWVTFYNDGTMVGDTVSHYFPKGQYVISGGWVVMFAIEGSDVDYYAKLTVENIQDYEMETVYVGSPSSPIGEDSLKIWMKKQEQ